MTRPTSTLKVTPARVAALAGLAVLAAGCSPTATPGTASDATPTAGSTTDSTDATDSTDLSGATGTYSATGEYTSPGGDQTVDVEVTLEDGVITAVTVTPGATDSQSQRYQQDFAANVASEVVGKSLEDVDVSTVASSSLTSQGFNDALDQIAEQAGA